MDKSPPQPNQTLLSRRRVFAGAGTAGALAAAAALLPAGSSGERVAASMPEQPADDAHGRYQLTQHVQRYYQTAKV